MKKIKFLLPLVAILVSILSAYYAWTGVQIAKKSNAIAQDTQEATKNIFLAEKRPYINVYVSELKTGGYLNVTHGNETLVSFNLELKNEGGIPARDIEINTHFFDEQLIQYNKVSIYVPETQKILSNKSHFVTMTMGGEDGTVMDKEIKSEKLLFQVEIKYKSDASTEIKYLTKKQFSITTDKVILIGNLGEFQ